MILPSKHLSQDRALLSVGANILRHLSRPITISALWEELPRKASALDDGPPLGYNEFVLALDLLFLIKAIEIRDGLLTRNMP